MAKEDKLDTIIRLLEELKTQPKQEIHYHHHYPAPRPYWPYGPYGTQWYGTGSGISTTFTGSTGGNQING